MLWSGATDAIPTGYVICDGNNSTPDLRDRFVVGAGSTYSVDATGGSANATLVSHTHTATSSVTDPGHFHSYNQTGFTGSGTFALAAQNVGSASGSTETKTTGISVSTSLSTEGSSATNANLPPYYALAYIMKT
jgi:microcystin-dependent protein